MRVAIVELTDCELDLLVVKGWVGLKLVTFSLDGIDKLGVMMGEEILDVEQAHRVMRNNGVSASGDAGAETDRPAYSMLDLLRGGETSQAWLRQVVAFAEANREACATAIRPRQQVRLEAPLRRPGKIICVGHNYREHILEMKREIPKYPVIFAKFSNTVRGPEDFIPLPPVTQQLDYEAEFAFVIGKTAKNVHQDEALEYVAGYTIANDVSARDLQRRTLQWLQGKTLDGSLPLGPYLVTKDEVPNPHELNVVLTVNGEERQRANTASLVFNVNILVEFLSQIMTLEPGDLVLTGTPGGVGAAMDPPKFLRDGDVVSITIDRLGTLSNRVQTV
jgi:acylpyruvate hydrolase